MAISLTYTDAQDGSGGTVVVAGADNALVTIYGQRVDASGLYTLAFAAVGTRSGNGTVALSLAVGTWWLYAQGLVSAAVAVSNFVYAPVADATLAVATRSSAAIRTRLMGLTMSGISAGAGVPNTLVYDRLADESPVVAYPATIIHLGDEAESLPGGTNTKDDVGYGYVVAIVDSNSIDNEAMRPVYQRWRQQYMRALRNQRLAGITEIMTVQIEPKAVIDRKLPEFDRIVSAFVARAISREVRG